jgi:hypothetical protein
MSPGVQFFYPTSNNQLEAALDLSNEEKLAS